MGLPAPVSLLPPIHSLMPLQYFLMQLKAVNPILKTLPMA